MAQALISNEVTLDVVHTAPLSHIAAEGSFEEMYSREVYAKMMKFDKYCSFFTCICSKVKLPTGQTDGSIPAPASLPGSANGSAQKICCGKVCLCSQSKPDDHTHGDCGHFKVVHDDHVDYLVNEVLHHQVGGICYSHGRLNLLRVEEESWEHTDSL